MRTHTLYKIDTYRTNYLFQYTVPPLDHDLNYI